MTGNRQFIERAPSDPHFTFLYLLCLSTFRGLGYSLEEFKWHSTNETWLEIHVKFCGRVCNGTTLVDTMRNRQCNTPLCFPCDCDPSCHIYTTCCPTWTDGALAAPISTTSDSLPHPDRFQCQHLAPEAQTRSFYTISDCDSRYACSLGEDDFKNDPKCSTKEASAHNLTIQRCRDPNTKTMDDVTPYLDLHHGIVYKNKFCAICNGYLLDGGENFTNISYVGHKKLAGAWSLQVSCDHYQYLFNITSEFEFFTAASGIYKRICRVTFNPPKSSLPPKECQADVRAHAGPSCLTSSDAALKDNCLNLSGRYLTVDEHKNIFCFLCSQHSDAALFCSLNNILRWGSSNHIKKTPAPPITLLFSLSRRQKLNPHKDGNCSSTKDVDVHKDQCKASECSPGKLETRSGTCSSVIKQIRGLGYKMSMTLAPYHKLLVTEDQILSLLQEIFKHLSDLSKEVDLRIDAMVSGNKWGANSTYVLDKFDIEAFLIGDHELERDEFERRLVKLAQKTWELTLLTNTSSQLEVKLFALLLGSPLLNISPVDMDQKVLDSDSCNRYMFMSHSLDVIDLYNDNSTKMAGRRIFKFRQTTEKTRCSLWNIKKDFIDVTYSLTCPYVVVNLTKLSIEEHSASVSFEYEGRTVELTSLQNISLVGDQLRICIDLFKMATHVTQSTDIVILILYYFQVVCVSVSIVCLILSFVTFCLFPSLRSLPGLNNMSLCLSLAIAQTCLLITVQYGVHGVLPPIYCLLHAIVLHYSWLASFLWMSACCIHMFRVFTCNGNQFINTRSDKQRHFKYCLYAFGVPLVMVAITMVINTAITSGESFGYDDTICFLDTRTSAMNIALSLLLPLCCMVLSNGVLFALTVRGIIHVTKIQETTTGRDSQGVMTYVKLSTLTGVFCIVAAVSVWLNNIPLQFVTSPLMALQGVFIFFSFIVNRRVGKLYSVWLGYKKSIGLSTSESVPVKSIPYNSTSCDTSATEI